MRGKWRLPESSFRGPTRSPVREGAWSCTASVALVRLQFGVAHRQLRAASVVCDRFFERSLELRERGALHPDAIHELAFPSRHQRDAKRFGEVSSVVTAGE